MDTTTPAARLLSPEEVEEAAVAELAEAIEAQPPLGPGIGLHPCPVCHGVVAMRHTARHARWHIDLRKSLRSGSGLFGAFNAGLAAHPPVI